MRKIPEHKAQRSSPLKLVVGLSAVVALTSWVIYQLNKQIPDVTSQKRPGITLNVTKQKSSVVDNQRSLFRDTLQKIVFPSSDSSGEGSDNSPSDAEVIDLILVEVMGYVKRGLPNFDEHYGDRLRKITNDTEPSSPARHKELENLYSSGSYYAGISPGETGEKVLWVENPRLGSASADIIANSSTGTVNVCLHCNITTETVVGNVEPYLVPAVIVEFESIYTEYRRKLDDRDHLHVDFDALMRITDEIDRWFKAEVMRRLNRFGRVTPPPYAYL